MRIIKFSGDGPVGTRLALFLIAALILVTACERQDPTITLVPSAVPADGLLTQTASNAQNSLNPNEEPTPTLFLVATLTPPPTYNGTPTPNSVQAVLDGDGQPLPHVIQNGETLSYLAVFYNTSVEEILNLNGLTEFDVLSVGQTVMIPTTSSAEASPAFKIIPDSELVYGPAAKNFNTQATIASFGGYIMNYQEQVEGRLLSGPQILQLVADRFSVNPRLLIALLEYKSGWITQPLALDNGYPMGYISGGYEGLYQQLSWTANNINMGYYGRAEAGIQTFDIGFDRTIAFSPEINDGTAGVQYFFGAYPDLSYDQWLAAVGENGLYATFNQLFSNPFAYTVDPLWPADLAQPPLKLPFAVGDDWYFTGGPHGGWAAGSAWAALDFAPGTDQLGCYQSDYWLTAVAPGVVSRSDFGAVVVDLDGDGFAGTGWSIIYMHVETRDRVPVGTVVETGDQLGHPSCEGGFSNGTHVHLSRTYNGRWVAADGNLPFDMAGWVSQGLNREYDGLLVRGDVVKEACECREEGNTITGE